MFPDYILLGNDWFYGRNNDGDQVYLAEIVTDAEDVWLRATLCIKELVRGVGAVALVKKTRLPWSTLKGALFWRF